MSDYYMQVVFVNGHAMPHIVIENGREYRIFNANGSWMVYDMKTSQRAKDEDGERIIDMLFGDGMFTTLALFVEGTPEDYDMNIYKTGLFNYLEGIMVKDKPVTMTICEFCEERVEAQGKSKIAYVLYFEKQKKGAILNKTNAKALAEAYGPETDEWKGQRVELYAEQGTAFGKTGYWLRVRPDGEKMEYHVTEEDDIPWESYEDESVDAGQTELFPDGVDVAIINGQEATS